MVAGSMCFSRGFGQPWSWWSLQNAIHSLIDSKSAKGAMGFAVTCSGFSLEVRKMADLKSSRLKNDGFSSEDGTTARTLDWFRRCFVWIALALILMKGRA